MESLIITLDPGFPGGVNTMQRAVAAAQRRMGLAPRLGFVRLGSRARWDLSVDAQDGAEPSISTGYLPTIEYLNYLVPALRLRATLRRFQVVHIVSGVHSAALVPILARRPFVSWIATPFLDEIQSRYGGADSSVSIRINHGLRAVNQALERWTLRQPRFVFALSGYTARRLQQLANVDPARMAVLRCPIDLECFRPRDARDRGPNVGCLRTVPGASGRFLFSAGRIDDPRKNIPSLVRAYAPIAAAHPSLDLVLAGKVQSSDNEVARLTRQLGLSDRVHFAGHRDLDDLATLYRHAEAYVSTSRQEGLGISIMEAQASGVPAVVMRCGGSDELMVTGDGSERNGWLVDQGDEASFTQALHEAASDGERRARFGAAARLRAEREYSFELFTARLRAVYREAFPDAAIAA
jgi:glycosyltransferase involved in cell wall biosynthesis